MSYTLKSVVATTLTVMAMITSVRCFCQVYCPTDADTYSSPWERKEPVGWVFGRMIGVSPNIVPRPGQVQPWGIPRTPGTGSTAVLPPRT